MKIAVISPDKNHAKEIGGMLEAQSHSVVLRESGSGRVTAVVEQDRPDLLLVDDVMHDAEALGEVEYLTTQYPNVVVILLCETQAPEFLIHAMRAGVREVLPSPVSATALGMAVARVAAKLKTPQARALGKILAFMPCKGGSGSTFLATNTGYQLAESSNVLLIDMNLQFGDALSFVYDGHPASTITNVAQELRRLDASFLAACTVHVSPNFSILAAPEDPSQAVEIKPEHIDAILSLAQTQYDFVLLDMGRSLDTLSIKALDRAYRIFAVMQASVPGLRNAKKLLGAFTALGYPSEKVEFIVNRFEKSGEIGLDDIQRLLGPTRLHPIANSFKEVNASINRGHPLIEASRSNVVARNLAAFTSVLSPKQEEARGLFGRLFKRSQPVLQTSAASKG